MLTTCSLCKSEFVCGAKDPASACWCLKKPILPITDETKSCLCAVCFDKQIAQTTATCFRLLISYVGTNFSGFQAQENARTVEGEIRKACAAIGLPHIELNAAGRTDAGVHARGQVVSITCITRLVPRQLMLALASKLPHDMAVWRVDQMPRCFDARRQSIGKRYVYRIYQGLVPDPFSRALCHFVRQRLDVDAMHDAALAFVGEHDFSSFRASLCTATHARRYVWHVAVQKSGPIIEIDIRGNAFCMNMVRIMAGTLIEVGRQKRTKAAIIEALSEKDRTKAGPTAPACGLTLEEIYYPDDLSTSLVPENARFPRYPVTPDTWGIEREEISYGLVD